jgi:hypothetical protein
MPVLAEVKSDAELSRTMNQKTDSIKYEFSLDGGNKFARLKIKARLEGGYLSWKLKDPKGNTRLDGEITSGDAGGDSGELKSIAGVWILEIDFREATGNYKINWTAR